MPSDSWVDPSRYVDSRGYSYYPKPADGKCMPGDYLDPKNDMCQLLTI